MRIAVCFSGQMRTALDARKSIIKFLGNHLLNVDFFFHTWDVKSEKKLFGDLRDDVDYTNEHYECLNKLLKIVKVYKPKKYVVESHEDFIGGMENKKNNPSLWYSWYRSLKLVKDFEKENGFEYDVVIKMRFDVIYEPNVVLDDLFVKYLSRIESGEFFADSIWKLDDEKNRDLIHDVFYIHNSKIINRLNIFYTDYISKIKEKENYHRVFGTFLNGQGIPFDECLPEKDKKWTPLREVSLKFFDVKNDFNKIVECNRILYNHDYQHLIDVRHIDYDTLNNLKKYTLKHMDYAPNVLGHLEPLKIAICMSGQLRTWDKCYQNVFKIIKKLKRNDTDIHFFCHTWDFESNSSPIMVNTGKDEIIPHDTDTLNKVLSTYKPKDHLFENYEKNKQVVESIKKEGYRYKNKTPITWSSQQFYSLMRAAEMKRKYEIDNGFDYDVCIRLRYDQYIPENEIDYIISMILNVKPNTVLTMHNRPHETYPFTIYGDVFWICNSLTYDKISSFYRALPTIDNNLFAEGNDTPPENVLTHYIKDLNIENQEMVIDLRICKTKDFIQKKLDLGLPGLGNNEIFYEDIVNDDIIKQKII
jgi:ribosomal protein S17E